MAGRAVLLLVNFRPEHGAAWLAEGVRRVGLSPLGREASLELIGRLLGGAGASEGLADRIHRRSGGNPLFIEELVRSLVEAGRLEGRPGGYRLVAPVEDLEIPETVRAVIAARIDRLSERDKGLLQVASVVVIGERLGERASLIAHHFEEAGFVHDAARWRHRAAFRVTHIVPRRPGPSHSQ